MTDLAQIRGEVLMPLKRRRGQSLSSLSIPVQSTASMVFAAGSLAVGSEVASPHAWVGEIRAGCDTAELAAITWACRWCTYRMCVKPSMVGLPVVLHVDSQHAISSVNGHARLAVCGVDCLAYWTSVDELAEAAAKQEVLSSVRRFFFLFFPRLCVVSDGTKIRRGLCNQVLVVLFRRSTGRQRHLIPTLVSPLFVWYYYAALLVASCDARSGYGCVCVIPGS